MLLLTSISSPAPAIHNFQCVLTLTTRFLPNEFYFFFFLLSFRVVLHTWQCVPLNMCVFYKQTQYLSVCAFMYLIGFSCEYWVRWNVCNIFFLPFEFFFALSLFYISLSLLMYRVWNFIRHSFISSAISLFKFNSFRVFFPSLSLFIRIKIHASSDNLRRNSVKMFKSLAQLSETYRMWGNNTHTFLVDLLWRVEATLEINTQNTRERTKHRFDDDTEGIKRLWPE